MTRKKPEWRKRLEGQKGPGKHPLSPPGAPDIPSMKMRRPPRWFGKYAKDFWNKTAPKLIKLNLLTELDVGCFEGLCCTYEHYRQSQDILDKEGLIVQDERKLPRKHPAWQMMRESRRQFFTMCKEFGLEPTGRMLLDIRVINEPDELDKFLGIERYID